MPWQPAELSTGFTGLALTCGQLHRCAPQQGWDRLAHVYLREAFGSSRVAETRGVGLFDGIAGVAFAANFLSWDGSRYGRLIESAESNLIPRANALCDRARGVALGCSFALFDIVSGLSGVGLYLTSRCEDERAASALANIVGAVAGLLLREGPKPAWRTPYEALPPNLQASFPSGNLNLGLAHGMPGMLAFLSLCRIEGIASAGLEEAIDAGIETLLAHSIEDEFGIDWPIAVALDDYRPGKT